MDSLFEKPRPAEDISDIDLAFPARALEFMPDWKVIPDDFKGSGTEETRAYIDYVHRWCFGLLGEDEPLFAREGINAQEAGRQLTMIGGSYAPKHEHKVAAMSMLMSLWFLPPGTKIPD